MKLTRHNGRSGKHGTYNPRHNDRRFDVENSEHIDAERARQNVYWDCYRRFLPIMIYPENAEVHILEDEDASRAYLLQVWAEAMTIYRSGHYSMKFSKSIQRQLVEVQKDFMPEDTEAGQIQGFLEHYTGSMVCSKQLFKEALGHTYDEPKRWQLHNINEIMNTVVTGWKPFSNPRMFAGYGRQKGWERDVSGNELPGNEDGFVELTEEECLQMELPKEWIA